MKITNKIFNKIKLLLIATMMGIVTIVVTLCMPSASAVSTVGKMEQVM